VVHKVDDVHRVDVYSGEPVHHVVEPVHDIVEVKVLTLNGGTRGTDLFAGDFVPAAVDSVKQALGQVGPGTKELHLFADEHWRHAAGDGPVVSPGTPHDFVAFKLNGARVDRHLCRKIAKTIGQARGIPDREIGLRRRAQVVKSLE